MCVSLCLYIAPSSNPLIPAIASAVVVVLLLITCVPVLVLALAVTATKANKLRAEKAYIGSQTGGGEVETKDRIYDEVGEGTDPIGEQKGHYQELKLETMGKKQYEGSGGEGETTEEIYEEMGEGTSNTEQQLGLYEEMDMGRMEERQYESINKKHTAATHKAGK